MLEWADGPRVFEHFRDLEGALRTADMHGYVRSLGLSNHPILPTTGLGTPMRHRGVNVGIFFLAGKAGGREFSSEDEDVLVLFAAQAATAIANARTYRDEHRPGPTWRRWLTPRRWVSRFSMPGPDSPCGSIGRRGELSRT